MIPIAVLACVLLLVGYKLTKPSLFIDMYRAGWSQFVPFVITVAGVVFTDLLKGIIMGLVAAVLILLRNSYKNSHFLHIEEQDSGNHVVKMTLAEEVTFLNKGAVRDALNKLPDGSEITIDMSKSFKVDSDVLEIIEDFKTSAQERNIRTHIID
jgi:MFS superfamily sulfate permease-like transporter